MAIDKVHITQTYRDDHWVVRAELVPTQGGTLPAEVFIYENTGGNTLGTYHGVCGLDDLQRLQVWQGVPIRKFGNRYVRHNVAEVHLTPGALPDRTVAIIRSGLTNLRNEMLSGSETSAVYDVA